MECGHTSSSPIKRIHRKVARTFKNENSLLGSSAEIESRQSNARPSGIGGKERAELANPFSFVQADDAPRRHYVTSLAVHRLCDLMHSSQVTRTRARQGRQDLSIDPAMDEADAVKFALDLPPFLLALP